MGTTPHHSTHSVPFLLPLLELAFLLCRLGPEPWRSRWDPEVCDQRLVTNCPYGENRNQSRLRMPSHPTSIQWPMARRNTASLAFWLRDNWALFLFTRSKQPNQSPWTGDREDSRIRMLLLLQYVFLDLIHENTILCCGPVSATSIPVYILIWL